MSRSTDPDVTSLLFVFDMHAHRKSFGVAKHVLTPPHIAHLSLIILMEAFIIKIKGTASQKTDGRNTLLYMLKTRFSSLVSYHLSFIPSTPIEPSYTRFVLMGIKFDD